MQPKGEESEHSVNVKPLFNTRYSYASTILAMNYKPHAYEWELR